MRRQSLFRQAFLLLCLVLSAVATTRHQHQVDDLLEDELPPLRRRQGAAGFFPVTGITDTGVQSRLEIRQLAQDADMMNVFLLGLRRFMLTDQREKLSYYQVAGIHGRPYIPWDNVGPAPGVNNPGYCTHVSNLFLTWHRGYLLLVEQLLFDYIIEVVNEFPAGAIRQRYASAAMRWRFPYWDWAVPPSDGQTYPSILTSPTVAVTMPNGTNTIPNPLYSYQFHPVSAQDFFFAPYSQWTDTKRNPTSLSQSAISNNQALGPILNAQRPSMMNRLYNLFTFYDNFTQFGNEAWINSNFQNADSLESLHSVIHNVVGNQGHMTYFDYSAFDPVFWFHHIMIDRCFALWQALYPNSRMETRLAVAQTYTIRVGDVESPMSPLAPFHSDTSGNLLTPAEMWDTRRLGYTYPELTGNVNPASIRAVVNQLYGGNAAGSGFVKRATAVNQAASKQQLESAPGEKVDGRYRQYIANIASQKFAMNGSYTVYIFLGDSGDDPTGWPLSPNLVGSHGVFAGLQSPGGSNHVRVKVTGTVPLTDGLLNKISDGELSSMDADTVTSYLHKNLNWRVLQLDGTVVDPASVPDLSVIVISAEVEPAAAVDQFPQWGNFTELRRATQGRPGGC